MGLWGYPDMGMVIAVQAVRGVVASDCVPQTRHGRCNVSRTKRSIGNLLDWATPVRLDHRQPLDPRLLPAARREAARRARNKVLMAGLVAAAVAAAILVAMPAAYAQDAPATPATGQASQPVTSPSATASPSAPNSSTTGSSAAPAAGAGGTGQTTGGQSGDGKSSDVCFPLTGHCVENSKASGTKAGTAAAKSSTPSKKPLNLTAPDVRTVVPEEELKEPLPNPDQITETQESDTVSVKGEQGVPPDVPVGLGAIWWAVGHPSQAWRILTPSE
jgi:hypothetical protein